MSTHASRSVSFHEMLHWRRKGASERIFRIESELNKEYALAEEEAPENILINFE